MIDLVDFCTSFSRKLSWLFHDYWYCRELQLNVVDVALIVDALW